MSKKIDIRQLIGDTVTDIKMYYEPQGENDWLDTVLTYITLKDNGVITFPFSGDLDFKNVFLDGRAAPISNKAYPLIIGQTIKELWYERDEDDEVANDWMAFIELSNGVVIHENRMAPHGTGAANLFILEMQHKRKPLFLATRKDRQDFIRKTFIGTALKQDFHQRLTLQILHHLNWKNNGSQQGVWRYWDRTLLASAVVRYSTLVRAEHY